MSFLNSVLANITGQPSKEVEAPPPLKPTSQQPINSNSEDSSANKKRKAEDAFKSPKKIPLAKSTSTVQDSKNATKKRLFPSPEDGRQLKKGSFQEIMARAQQSKATPNAGKIQHKKMVPKTAEQKRAWKANYIKSGRKSSSARSSKSSSPGLKTEKDRSVNRTDREKQTETPATKPKPRLENTYKGTANMHRVKPEGETSKRQEIIASNSSKTKRQRVWESDEDDDEDEYESDASSDMEATGFDVEEEERKSALTAKREDELALREEEELRRAKEKRRRLAALAEGQRLQSR